MASLAVLRTKTRRLLNEEDTSNTNFDDDELTDCLNQATVYLGTEMEWPIQTSEATSITDQALYSLPDDFISLTDAYFDNQPLTVIEREDLKVIQANWQDADSNVPQYVYKSDNRVIGLFPAPNSDNADLSIQIQYVSLPQTLTDDGDVPDLHEAFQICLPFYAAYLCELKAGNDKRANMQMANYELHKKNLMSRVQRFSDDLFRFRWMGIS